MPRRALVAIVLAAVVGLPGAGAFFAVPGGPHDDITSAAVREAGAPEEVVGPIVEAVRAIDLRDSRPSEDGKGTAFEATADYRPEHHCDRVPPASDLQAFNATVAYIADRSAAAAAAAQREDADAAVRTLGELLHAVQDCFSHSNAVDLADPHTMVLAVNGHAPPPPGLRLTGYQPGAEEEDRPAGDPYPHADFAKDFPHLNAEADSPAVPGLEPTKFEAARALAIEASILALQDVLVQIEPEQLQRLAAASDGGGQQIPRVGTPGLPPLLAVLAVVALAGAARRRER